MFRIELWSEEFADDWEKICQSSAEAWFWHTRNWVNYSWHYGHQRVVKDLSFLIFYKDSPVAVCPIFLEKILPAYPEKLELAFAGGHCWGIVCADDLSESVKRKTVEEGYKFIDELADKNNALRIRMANLPNHSGDFIASQMATFQQNNYLDTSYLTQIIDLQKPIESLWSDVRERYRSRIRKGEKELQIAVYDKNSDSLVEAFENYVKLHGEAARRVTRPRVTFDLMLEWIRDGKCFLVEGKYNNQLAIYAYIIAYKDRAYYGSGCASPNLDLPYLMHTAQWTATKYLADNNFNWYEIGNQDFNQTLVSRISEKDKSISFFKRGMGGKTIVGVRGEKYFNADLFAEVWHSNIDNYKTFLGEILTKKDESL